jgi:predicted component of viral defense system (DUF524 family)
MGDPSIAILDSSDNAIAGKSLTLFFDDEQDYELLSEAEAREYGEARHQIFEGTEYEYELPAGWSFEKHMAISPSAVHKNTGRLRTGNLVGLLRVKVMEGEHEVGHVDLQIRAKKLAFREQYRKMLEDIAEVAAELAMATSEFTFQSFEVDPSSDRKTRYEQFAFVRSLLGSDSFKAAIGKICSSPLTAMKDVEENRRTDSLRRMGRDVVRQFASGANRIELPAGYPLRVAGVLKDIPRYVRVMTREETVDVPENRFVKHVLETFMFFSLDVAVAAKDDSRLQSEANFLAEQLESMLLEPLFKDVSRLERMELSSPALQRREGYREVLRAWVMFQMAAKICWTGGEDVYGAGNRNIAVLYEYWVFFELLKIVSEVFDIPAKEKECLLEKDEHGLELMLCRGRTVMLKGVYNPGGMMRPMRVRFYYNKTFSKEATLDKQGSWTVDMRPDYTISIWPDDYSEEKAEELDSIVHIHFDAKYRIENFKEIFVEATNEKQQQVLNEFHAEEDHGTFKRGDLLKMHAYNDAIRRTYGSYILYPGKGEDAKRRYREIIPGIGAFELRPIVNSDVALGSVKLKVFLMDVANALENRVTQLERLAKYGHHVHKDEPIQISNEAMKLKLPEDKDPKIRPFIPSEEWVIVGYFRNNAHLQWILRNYYNLRLGDVRGTLHVTHGMTLAKYLLLHGPGEASHTNRLFKIDYVHSRMVWSKKDLVDAGYPGTPSGEYYLMFKLKPIVLGEPLYGGTYNICKLNGYGGGRNSSKPFDTTFTNLLQRGVVRVE